MSAFARPGAVTPPVARRARGPSVYAAVAKQPTLRDGAWGGRAEEFERMLEALRGASQRPRSASGESRRSVVVRRLGEEDTARDDACDTFDLHGRGMGNTDAIGAMAGVGQGALVVDLSANELTAVPFLATQLRVLNLACNKLVVLADLEPLVCLEELDVSRNCLESLEGLYRSAETLRTLNASHNRLTSVSGLETMSRLQCVDVGHNRLASLASIRALSCNFALMELRLAGNPVGCRPSIRQIAMDLVPSLLSLDDVKTEIETPRSAPTRPPEKASTSGGSPSTPRSYSALDRIGAHVFPEECEVHEELFRADQDLEVAFDSEYEMPLGRQVVEQLRQSARYPLRPLEPQQQPHPIDEPRSNVFEWLDDVDRKSKSSELLVPDDADDIVTEKIQELIDRKKRALAVLLKRI